MHITFCGLLAVLFIGLKDDRIYRVVVVVGVVSSLVCH